MLFTDLSLVVKIENFHEKKKHSFNIIAQNIDRWYTLEPPRRSNEHPQSICGAKIRKNRYALAYPSLST